MALFETREDKKRRERLERFKTERLTHFDLFSFEEALDYYVAEFQFSDRPIAKDWFLSQLEKSIVKGEFGNRVGIVTERHAYLLSADLIRSLNEAYEPDIVKDSYLVKCWTTAELGLCWCERRRIELSPRWKFFRLGDGAPVKKIEQSASLPSIIRGRPPNPNKTTFIDAFERRRKKGLTSKTLAEEARQIEHELKGGHSLGTIKNTIRPFHQSWRQTNSA